jgi:hypothetical protein
MRAPPMTKLAVVIPYFQTTPGILRRALVAVLQQRLPPVTIDADKTGTSERRPIEQRTEWDAAGCHTP